MRVRGLIASLLLVAAPSQAAPNDWDVEMPMTSTGGDVWGEGIATAGSMVHMIYGTNEVRYRSSMNEGATWSADRRLDTGVLHLTDPIVADGNDVWIIYLKDIQNRSDWCCSRDLGNIYLLHSGNAGSTWEAPRRLTTNAQAYRLSIAYSSNRLHIVWMDFRSGAWDTYYLRSPDRGATWDTETRIAISAGTFGAERPQIAARGDGIHVTIWDDRGANPPCMAGPTFSFTTCPDTFYIGSLDGGTTWSSEIAVSYSGAAIAGRNDVAVAGSSSVVINFNRSAQNTADANPHMFTVHSPDNGKTWDPAIQLTNQPGQADHGSIIGDGPRVHLAWHDSRDGALAIYYTLSTTEGTSWIPEERVSTATGTDSSTPLDAVTASYVHVMWLDHRSGTYQIYYRRRAVSTATNGGGDAATGDTTSGGNEMGNGGGCGCASSRTDAASAVPFVLVVFVLRRRRVRARSSNHPSRSSTRTSFARTSCAIGRNRSSLAAKVSIGSIAVTTE